MPRSGYSGSGSEPLRLRPVNGTVDAVNTSYFQMDCYTEKKRCARKTDIAVPLGLVRFARGPFGSSPVRIVGRALYGLVLPCWITVPYSMDVRQQFGHA